MAPGSWLGQKCSCFGRTRPLSDPNAYRDVSNSENILPKLLEARNKMFSSLKGKEQKNNLNILHAGVKGHRILVKFTYFQKPISDFLKSPEDL